MTSASPSQLAALARIKFNGLRISPEDPFDSYAIASLDVPAPYFERVNIATVRKLVKQGWILDRADEEGDRTWELTPRGNALLEGHKQHLEEAGRESAHFQGGAVLQQIANEQKPEREKTRREWAERIEWTKAGLRAAGFKGFIPFDALPLARVPRTAGVYAVLRLSDTSPKFRRESVAGTYKGKSPSVGVEGLLAKWVQDMTVLYLGKAEVNDGNTRGLAKRLDEYRRHGLGEHIGHWGGRYVWQLEDCDDLLVAWKETPTNGAESFKSVLLSSFIDRIGVLPFANLRGGRRPSKGTQ